MCELMYDYTARPVSDVIIGLAVPATDVWNVFE